MVNGRISCHLQNKKENRNRMAPIQFTVVDRLGKKIMINADSEDDILQLTDRVSEAKGIPKEQFDLLPKGTSIKLSNRNGEQLVKDIGYWNNQILLFIVKPTQWQLRKPNTRSLLDPNEKRYHTRILEEKLQKHQKNRERKALQTISEQRGLPENLERAIGKFLGGKRKSRRSKKSRRVTRRRR